MHAVLGYVDLVTRFVTYYMDDCLTHLSSLLTPPPRRAAKKVVEDIAKEAVIAARISGVRPNMHVILSPNTDGDEATITTADIIAGRSYLHKVRMVTTCWLHVWCAVSSCWLCTV